MPVACVPVKHVSAQFGHADTIGMIKDHAFGEYLFVFEGVFFVRETEQIILEPQRDVFEGFGIFVPRVVGE